MVGLGRECLPQDLGGALSIAVVGQRDTELTEVVR